MKSPEHKKRSRIRTDRRSFLMASAAGLSVFGVGAAQSAGAQMTDEPDVTEFYVEGRQLIRTMIRPKQVEIVTHKISPDLKERYGSSVLKNRETIERPEPDRDDLPHRKTIVENEPWSGYVADEAEWVALADSDNADQIMMSVSSTGEVGPALAYPSDFPKFYHNNEDGRWVLSGPINLVGSFLYDDASDCASNIADNGNGHFWTTSVTDATRYALIDGTYQRQEASVASGPFGVFGRTHARLWDAPRGYTLIAAHQDDRFPHKAVSYLEAEYRIADFMTSDRDRYDADNDEHWWKGQMKDHNGKVTYLFET